MTKPGQKRSFLDATQTGCQDVVSFCHGMNEASFVVQQQSMLLLCHSMNSQLVITFDYLEQGRIILQKQKHLNILIILLSEV